MTRKREIENYMHPSALERLSNGRITLPAGANIDFDDIPALFGNALAAAKAAHGNNLGFHPDDHRGERLSLGTRETRCKKIITSYIMRRMSAEEIRQRSAYKDPKTGEDRNEVKEWLEAIRACITEAVPA